MLTLKQANMLDLIKINKINSDFQQIRNTLDFYSEFNGGFISSILKGSVYIVENKNIECALIIVEKGLKEVFFIPKIKSISIFNLFHLINRSFNLLDFSLKIVYRKINLNELKKYFNLTLSENMMYMHRDMSLPIESLTEVENTLLYRPLKIYSEEALRMELQNDIFNSISGRSMLTIEEIIEEYSNPKFLKNLCFLLEYYRNPIGYGQILKFDDQYMLVNFGIRAEYRKKGFAFYFINNIFRDCRRAGIEDLYLSVDKDNISAIKLYERTCFKEIYNKVTINFKTKNG